MTNPTFRARVRPKLHPAAQELVAIYEAVPGALTYPGCMPEALAAVLKYMGKSARDAAIGRPVMGADVMACRFAALLRGEEP